MIILMQYSFHAYFCALTLLVQTSKIQQQQQQQQTKVQCLKRLTDATAHSLGSGIEVITGTYPMKICIRELCSREYL